MTHEAFFSALKQGNIERAYLFSGEEEHVKEKALEALRARLLPEGLEALNETVLTNPAADAVIAAAETLPLMADRRLVIIRESALLLSGRAASEADESARLAEYLDRLPETACLVFYCRAKPDGRKKLTQALGKKAAVVQFDPLNDAALQRWVRQQFCGHGKRIDSEQAGFLVFTVGRELLTLVQEIAKVSAYAEDREEIAQADILAVATPTLECTVFQMVDALVEGRQAEAFRLLHAMVEHGEARIGILAMMARQYRNLLYLKLMQQEGLADAEIQRTLGVPPFAIRRLKAQSANAQAAALREKLDLCVDTDFAIKSGRMREDAALERAILRLSAPA